MKHDTSLIEIFSQSDLFVGVGENNFTEICRLGLKQVFEPGAMLFLEGDPASMSYMIVRGRIKLSKMHHDGKEAIVRYIGPGETSGAVSVFNGKNYPVTAQSIGPTEAIGWNRDAMLRLMTDFPQIAINLLGLVLKRLGDMQTRFLELQTVRVEERIARALLRIMNQSGRKTDEGILIDFRLSRQDLAEYTGTNLYTASRILSSWEKKGWIASGRERIVVVDPHALVVLSESG